MSQNLNVMIVDDSAITIKKITKMLNDIGHKVIHTCQTGALACSGYGQYNPDIVTMDITMPDMDGIEATQKIIEQYPEAIIIMVTAHGQEQMVIDAIEAVAKGYVLKPIKKDILADRINKVIENYMK